MVFLAGHFLLGHWKLKQLVHKLTENVQTNPYLDFCWYMSKSQKTVETISKTRCKIKGSWLVYELLMISKMFFSTCTDIGSHDPKFELIWFIESSCTVCSFLWMIYSLDIHLSINSKHIYWSTSHDFVLWKRQGHLEGQGCELTGGDQHVGSERQFPVQLAPVQLNIRFQQ